MLTLFNATKNKRYMEWSRFYRIYKRDPLVPEYEILEDDLYHLASIFIRYEDPDL
jgi:hypothetical protein